MSNPTLWMEKVTHNYPCTTIPGHFCIMKRGQTSLDHYFDLSEQLYIVENNAMSETIILALDEATQGLYALMVEYPILLISLCNSIMLLPDRHHFFAIFNPLNGWLHSIPKEHNSSRFHHLAAQCGINPCVSSVSQLNREEQCTMARHLSKLAIFETIERLNRKMRKMSKMDIGHREETDIQESCKWVARDDLKNQIQTTIKSLDHKVTREAAHCRRRHIVNGMLVSPRILQIQEYEKHKLEAINEFAKIF